MEHPRGRCDSCGERVFADVEGGYRCHNCGARYERNPVPRLGSR